MWHETSLTLVYDGLDGGMHQASCCGVFGLVLQAYSHSTFSTSCLNLALALLDFSGEECLQRMLASGWLRLFVLGALGIGGFFH
jgi:hypothetical protein